MTVFNRVLVRLNWSTEIECAILAVPKRTKPEFEPPLTWSPK
jgi:hypothetical protein